VLAGAAVAVVAVAAVAAVARMRTEAARRRFLTVRKYLDTVMDPFEKTGSQTVPACRSRAGETVGPDTLLRVYLNTGGITAPTREGLCGIRDLPRQDCGVSVARTWWRRGSTRLRSRVLVSMVAVTACGVLLFTLPLAWALAEVYRSGAVVMLQRDAVWVAAEVGARPASGAVALAGLDELSHDVDVGLLVVVLGITSTIGRLHVFEPADRITLVFAGSKKSLVNGMPMAAVLFGPDAGSVVLPIMIFHEAQLLVCSTPKRRASETAPPHQ